MLRRFSTYSGIDWNFVALALAGGLLYALLTLLIRPDLAPHGHREVRGDSCLAAPLGWEHLSLTGDYAWNAEDQPAPGELRPL